MKMSQTKLQDIIDLFDMFSSAPPQFHLNRKEKVGHCVGFIASITIYAVMLAFAFTKAAILFTSGNTNISFDSVSLYDNHDGTNKRVKSTVDAS